MAGTTFRDGFIEGFKTVAENNAAIPAIPAQPSTPAGKTAYQVGPLEGMEVAQKRKGGK
jgi:hypothetical protein